MSSKIDFIQIDEAFFREHRLNTITPSSACDCSALENILCMYIFEHIDPVNKLFS